jgi:hypothetical protein
LCGFAVFGDANNLLLCWLSSTFLRTLGLFANIFQAWSILGGILDELIGWFFLDFRVSDDFFFDAFRLIWFGYRMGFGEL